MFKESSENALYKRQVFIVVTKIGSGGWSVCEL